MTDSILRNATILHLSMDKPESIKGFHNNWLVLDVSEENRCWKAVKDAMLDNCDMTANNEISRIFVYELTQKPPLN